jgi:3-phosphoshikimate 1-carboxyvinyltransferase
MGLAIPLLSAPWVMAVSDAVAANAAAGPGRFLPATCGLRGRLSAPGDKSVSHRAVLFGAVNDGPVEVTGFLQSADTDATVRAVEALGVRVERSEHGMIVHGRGWEGLREPEEVIDVANSGTLIRLLPGLVASRDFFCVLTGDASIRRRPMARVLQPLAAMGASVAGRKGSTLPPISIRGGQLRGMSHTIAVASAQVKSCVEPDHSHRTGGVTRSHRADDPLCRWARRA